ncbi:MAG: hypothetical protein R2932_52290 [Caldilineaceae bacterium]
MWSTINRLPSNLPTATATLNMVGGATASRSLHLIGTTGEIQGNLEDSRFVIRHIDPRPGHEYSEEIVDLTIGGDMTGAFGGHGGGDLRLMADFVRLISGGHPRLPRRRWPIRSMGT